MYKTRWNKLKYLILTNNICNDIGVNRIKTNKDISSILI